MEGNETNNPYKPLRFLENPLPVPKRHEHKEADYDHEVPFDQMHYDVSVPDTDDFDL